MLLEAKAVGETRVPRRGASDSNAQQAKRPSLHTARMQLRSLLLAPLLFAAASAAQLAIQNARLTIDSAEGSQLVSETYVFNPKAPVQYLVAN